MNITQRTKRVREEALRLGFDACGFAKAQRLEQEESPRRVAQPRVSRYDELDGKLF